MKLHIGFRSGRSIMVNVSEDKDWTETFDLLLSEGPLDGAYAFELELGGQILVSLNDVLYISMHEVTEWMVDRVSS